MIICYCSFPPALDPSMKFSYSLVDNWPIYNVVHTLPSPLGSVCKVVSDLPILPQMNTPIPRSRPHQYSSTQTAKEKNK